MPDKRTRNEILGTERTFRDESYLDPLYNLREFLRETLVAKARQPENEPRELGTKYFGR